MANQSVSWVILTQGDRPDLLQASVNSVLHLSGPTPEIVLVSNAGGPLPQFAQHPKLTVVELAENVGIPAGRNAGFAQTMGEFVFFLDDDAEVASSNLVEQSLELFGKDPKLGVLSFRLVDPISGETERRHVPRLRVDDPTRSGDVTTFLGGACAMRRSTVDAVGGYPDQFFYAMEESDMAWRVLDAGYRVHYLGQAEVCHPATKPGRHGMSTKLTARNRVWLAKRRLPFPLAAMYLTVWTVLTVGRTRSLAGIRDFTTGLAEGFRTSAGPRQPMRWRTALRMAKLGRPPVI